MTRLVASAAGVRSHPHRYRLSRAGVLNVWQYDEQVFDVAEGRLLLRGANGAGKSKTLEMLLPFVLDGDKARMTASARHHTSLLWLMLDGVTDVTTRTGYLWVEFARTDEAGSPETFTCGVGIRASQSARSATAWFFTSPTGVGAGLELSDAAGPLSRDRLRTAVAELGGASFDQARAYKEHVGRALFGLEPGRYDELLRLLYWLRQPQVGEDIEPGRLAEILSVALPELDEAALRTVGETFDELAEFGERLARRERAVTAARSMAEVYGRYARGILAARGRAVVSATQEAGRRRRDVEERARALEAAQASMEEASARATSAEQRVGVAGVRLRELESSPAADAQRLLQDKARRADELAASARDASERAVRDHRRAAQTAEQARDDAAGLADDIRGATAAATRLSGNCATLLPGQSRTAVLPEFAEPHLREPADADTVTEAATVLKDAVVATVPLVGSALAAVAVLEDAVARVEVAEAAVRAAEARLADAEIREEQAASAAASAARAAQVAESDLAAGMQRWQGDSRAVPVEVPVITSSSVGSLRTALRAALTEETERRAAVEGDALARVSRLSADAASARARRGEIEAERDAQPPAPHLPRTPRDERAALPLWRLVDFVPGLDTVAAAGLEAALQASGLLDALIMSDGSVLPAATLDAVILTPVGDESAVLPDARSVLRPAVPIDSPVAHGVVESVLARVALMNPEDPRAETRELPAWISPDGSWRLGVLSGRADKPRPQYVGASARAAERLRRLAEIDAQIAGIEESLVEASALASRAGQERRDLDAWLDALPSTLPVVRAWTTLAEREAASSRAGMTASEARQAAEQARRTAAMLRESLLTLAAQNRLPADATGLRARRDSLRDLQRALDDVAASLTQLVRRAAAWRTTAERAVNDQHTAELSAGERDAADSRAAEGVAELAGLRERLGADVSALEQALREAGDERAAAQRAAATARSSVIRCSEQLGTDRSAALESRRRLEEHSPVLAAGIAELARTPEAPGLLAAAVPGDRSPDDQGSAHGLALAAGYAAGDRVPPALLALARDWSALDEDQRAADDNAVLRAHADLAAGPAADSEPRVVEAGGALCVLARDDGGEHPLAVLVGRLAAQVTADRDLLSDRERSLFEEHLLGDLGEALRARRIEAADLVAAMNALLDGVTTSQGIAVRLDWALREDVPQDVRDAAALLARPLGALLPDERTRLRDAMHRLIETSRAEDPTAGYSEHLQRALDYRRWSQFRVRITRPETPGQWTTLTRRTPLSQGEQKVVCYLPLFAAAAAHFTSVAGAAPHAPRIVLLDDAFPKIDARTHPLLFGLLVQLDLDFVVTSERLWGDHSTVPALSIYEALRSPSERGIAQYHHRWDGTRLHAVGA